MARSLTASACCMVVPGANCSVVYIWFVSFEGGKILNVTFWNKNPAAPMKRKLTNTAEMPTKAILRLHRKGYSNAEIATKMGRTVARVEQLLLLANANSDVHALVKEGRVSADGAIEAVRVHGEDAGEYLLSILESGGTAIRKLGDF